ncbi:MAG: cytochrome P450, partial [Catenulispora sp.]
NNPKIHTSHMRAFRPRIETLARGLLDQIAEQGSPADLHQVLARPLPILVICELLGVPFDDRDEFCGWSEDVGDWTDKERSARGLTNLRGYARELVARKRREPGDDVVSRLCAVEGVGDEEIADLSMRLLVAGHETTVVPIGLGVLSLLVHPEQRAALMENPDLVPGAVEEILRAPGWITSSGGRIRYATEDMEIGGQAVKTGDLVVLATRAANHDPRTFEAPNDFDITRDGPAHLAFGFGPHYCIGAPLARMELQVVFSMLPGRFPKMRLAVPITELQMRTNAVTGGLTTLPVEW